MRSKFSFLLMLAFLVCAGARAEERTMRATAWVDYQEGVIVVSCQTPVQYPQRITAVLYSAAVSSPTVNDYLRIAEVDTNGDGSAELSLPIGQDLAGGEYKIAVRGSGYQSDISAAVISQSLIGHDEIDNVLDSVNKAAAQDLDHPIALIADAVGIEYGPEYTADKVKFLNTFYQIKLSDFGGTFASLNEVRAAWDIAEAVRALATADASDIQKLLEDKAAILGLDTDNADYKADAAGVAAAFAALNRGNGTAENAESAQRNFLHAIVVNCINKSSVGDMETYLKRYADLLEIEGYMSRYEKLDKTKVGRQLNGRGFKDVVSIKNAFTGIISLLEQSGGSGGGLGGGSGSGGGSGGSSDFAAAPRQEEPTPYQPVFSDIDEFPWAADSIEILYVKQIVAGYGDGTFQGGAPVKREEFVKMLVVALNLYNPQSGCDFSDIRPGDWFYSYTASAAEAGLVTGRPDGSFGAGGEITRQDMAVMLHRACSLLEINLGENNSETEFTDASDFADYAAAAIDKLAKGGILSGFEDGSFKPEQSLSRAQAAKVIHELLKKGGEW